MMCGNRRSVHWLFRIIQVKEDVGLNSGGSDAEAKIGWFRVYFSDRVEEFAHGFDVKYERNRVVKGNAKVFGLSSEWRPPIWGREP